MEQKMLDRATYKKIKSMTREEMQNFLTIITRTSWKMQRLRYLILES